MSEKVALFDFCETLANFQTGDAFVYYVVKHYVNKKNVIRERFRKCLKSIKIIDIIERFFPKLSFNKRLVLWQLKGYDFDTIEKASKEYYENVVKPNLIVNVLTQMLELQEDGWKILIVSAGYEVYLKWFCKDYQIDEQDLISVKILFNRKQICQGRFNGGDRLWDKVDILNKRFSNKEIKSVAYSDSISDLPMLEWADDAFVVRNINKPKWNYKYKELLWE